MCVCVCVCVCVSEFMCPNVYLYEHFPEDYSNFHVAAGVAATASAEIEQ